MITQQRDPVPHHRLQLVRLVANATVMGESDPAPRPDRREPLVVGRVMYEVIPMLLDGQAGRPEDVRETVAEVAIGEVDERQAARS